MRVLGRLHTWREALRRLQRSGLRLRPCRFSEMSMMVESLSIFYTQRDNLFYPAWAFALPTTLLRIPYSLLESFLWSIIVYWSVGLAPTAARFFTFWLLLFLSHQARPKPRAMCTHNGLDARSPAYRAHAWLLLSA